MILNRRTLLWSLAAATATLPFAGSGVSAQSKEKLLRIGLSTYPAHFRPWINVGYAGHLVSSLINCNLLSYDTKGALVGKLAERWERENDTTWRFDLREASFHDGKPVTSADVKWTFERIMAKETGAYMHEFALQIERIDVMDAKSFRIITKTPSATIPSLMAYPFLAIIQAGSTDKKEEGIGAGPYTITSAEKGVAIVLTASQHYFREGLPTIRQIRIIPYADENLRVAALQSGDVDLIDYVPWNAMDTIAKSENLILDVEPPGAFMYLSFNGSGPFADKRLRQAVCYALRREEFVKAVFFGHGAPLQGVPRPTMTPYYSKELASYWTYDPDRARALLKEAGRDKGLTVTLLATSQYTMHRDTAVMVQTQLAEIGITVKMIMPDWATRVTMAMRGQGDFAVQGVGIDSFDPDAATVLIEPSQVPAFMRSRNFEVPGLAELLAKGRAEFDESKRKAIYEQVDKLACENASFCGVAYRATGFARSKAVGGLKLLPEQLSPFSAVFFDELTIT